MLHTSVQAVSATAAALIHDEYLAAVGNCGPSKWQGATLSPSEEEVNNWGLLYVASSTNVPCWQDLLQLNYLFCAQVVHCLGQVPGRIPRQRNSWPTAKHRENVHRPRNTNRHATVTPVTTDIARPPTEIIESIQTHNTKPTGLLPPRWTHWEPTGNALGTHLR